MHSYAPYQTTSVRRRGVAFERLPAASAVNAYVAALDVSADAVTIVDRAGLIVYSNASAEALFGRGNLVGRRLLSLYSLERSALRAILRDIKHAGLWQGRLPRQPGGVPLEIDAALRAVSLAPGKPQHFCLVARVLGAKATQQAHAAAEATVLSTVGRVAGEIAHDFNNQIAVVINYSSILLRQLPNDSPLREHVTEMQQAAWRASQVAQELLGFGGQRDAEPDDIDLAALLTGIRALFSHALGADTQLDQLVADDLWRVRARRAPLEWLLVELASRMRATLGRVERLRIVANNAEPPDTRRRAVVISLEAQPSSAAGLGSGRGPSLSSYLPNPSGTGLRGAELALAHSQAEITTQELPHGGLRYHVSLPVS